ncbi:MAG: biopolymer transporter ExbD [Candidatus Theseobacter exili]|nr:biopolymer transporter ExbD [Candidatus Theseobacter exili]
MKIARKKKNNFIMVPVASMGDIAFLLIIFFMLTSNFMKESKLKLEEPQAPDIQELKDSQLSVSVDEDGNIYLQGAEINVDNLKSEVEAYLSNKDDKTVMLKIDKKLKQEQFGDIFIELSKSGAEIALVGIKTNE